MDKVKKISEYIYEIPKEGKMNVPGIIYSSDKMIKAVEKDDTIQQIKNVASLPGIVEKSLAMPDAHRGYGMPIGGVAAFDMEAGIVSPGMNGYDINCGVRLLVSDITLQDFMSKRGEIVNEIFKNIPSGVGKKGEFVLSEKEIDEVLNKGVAWAVKKGYATKEDEELCEDNGCIKGADAKKVSKAAKARGKSQLGTIGAGNHFLEIQIVEKIYDKKTAAAFGLKDGQICIMIHSGSRGLGHEVASDYIKAMQKEYGVSHLPDKGLVYAPVNSKLGKDYLAAMAAAANFAFANRQAMTYLTRKSFEKFLPKSKLKLVYDIAHNIIKFEEFEIEGKKKTLCVHRKGATRSFGAGRKEVPERYRKVGQPIFTPGSMGTYSYVQVGDERAKELSFCSTAHGAGRVLSRTYAMENFTPEGVRKGLEKSGILLKANSPKGFVEEAPEAYKDVNEVVKISDALGLGKIVARLKPIAVIKG